MSLKTSTKAMHRKHEGYHIQTLVNTQEVTLRKSLRH